jgi:hypothetical protein
LLVVFVAGGSKPLFIDFYIVVIVEDGFERPVGQQGVCQSCPVHFRPH